MVEVRHLLYFVAVAEELHFGRAAERLHMAQSPLSQQIRQLERQLGVELINRSHHVVGLTDAGEAFLRAAKATLEELDNATRTARRAARGEVGAIRIGYVNEVTADLLPLSLKAFKDRHPDIELDLREGTTGRLLDDLRRRKVDVAFVRSPGQVNDLSYEQVIEESLMLAGPADGLDLGEPRALAALSDEGFVLPDQQLVQGLRRDIDAAFREAGFEPHVVREAGPLTAVLLLVAAGAGMALTPASSAHLYPVPGVDYGHFRDPVPTTSAGMAWRAGDTSIVLSRFLDVTRELASRYSGEQDVWPERHITPRDPP